MIFIRMLSDNGTELDFTADDSEIAILACLKALNNDYNVELYKKNEKLLAENQELKKQLDELQTLYNNMFKCHCNRVQVETLLEQQKEFIEWLEKMSKNLFEDGEYGISATYGFISSIYKEIIGNITDSEEINEL